MKRPVITDLRVGIFMLVGVVLAMWVIFMLGSEHKLFKRHYSLVAQFKDISGLRNGATVLLSGLKVGSVSKISFPLDPKDEFISVILTIGKDYQNRIRSDSIATVNTQGLLGDKFVFVTMGSTEGTVLQSGSLIPTEEGTAIFQLAEKAGGIMDDIGKAASSLSDLMTSVDGEKKGDLKGILSSLRKSMEQVEKGKGVLHGLIYDPQGERLVEDLSATMKAVRNIVTDVDKNADKKEVEGLVINLRRSSKDLREILDSIRRGEGTLGKLIMDPELYNDLRTLLGRANRNKMVKSVIRATIREKENTVIKDGEQ
ncbi:MAG: MlaD family protein [Pseudomonadota bacterium]